MDTDVVEKMANKSGGFNVSEMLKQNGVQEAFKSFQNRKNNSNGGEEDKKSE